MIHGGLLHFHLPPQARSAAAPALLYFGHPCPHLRLKRSGILPSPSGLVFAHPSRASAPGIHASAEVP